MAREINLKLLEEIIRSYVPNVFQGSFDRNEYGNMFFAMVPVRRDEGIQKPTPEIKVAKEESVFVQGRFDPDSTGRVIFSKQRVPISVSNHPETFNK